MHSYDLDDANEFDAVLATVTDYRTSNFVVEFDDVQARCTVDVEAGQLQQALSSENSKHRTTRWLNLWSAEIDQREAVRSILLSYGVSQRLTGLLGPRVARPPSKPSSPELRSHAKTAHARTKADHDSSHSDLAEPKLTTELPEPKAAALSIDSITKDLWHFCSIDWGHRYTCICYNALFTATSEKKTVLSRQPDAIKVWSAIVLFDDGLIVSNFDTPAGLPLPQIKAIRKNQVNILKNLSRRYDPAKVEADIFQVDIRPPASSATGVPAFSAMAVASLVYYYLFDDWRATFELVSNRRHPCRQKLDDIRARMSKAPAVDDVEKLHQIGQQLVLLQKVYEGYEKIIERLLQRQRHLSSSLWRTAQRSQSALPTLSRHTSDDPLLHTVGANDSSADASTWLTEADYDHKTVKLPLVTVVRFERLLDRVRLYALKEIQECSAEKEALVFLTFNLVNLKNATAIERLTRTTILLAKVTILFLPVSLMTAYFGLSMQAIDQMYSITTYWVCFGVVGALTSVLLVVYTVSNSKVAGQINYQSLTRMLMQGAKRSGSRLAAEHRKVV